MSGINVWKTHQIIQIKGGEVMRVHICAHRLCREVIPKSQLYCAKHAPLHQTDRRISNKQYDLHYRDQQANAFYHSTQWQSVRNYVFNRDYATCAVCGRTDNTLIADHIVRRDLCGDQLNTDNLWLLCRQCHNTKTRLEVSIMNSSNGKNKLKHISKERWKAYIQEKKS